MTTRDGCGPAPNIDGASFYSYLTYSGAWDSTDGGREGSVSRSGCRSSAAAPPSPA